MPDEATITKVRIAARVANEATCELDDAIRQASEDGWSLRQIGQAASLSHEQVRRILARHNG